MQRILYRDLSGKVEHVPAGRPGQALITNPNGLGWQDFTADKLPYVDASGHALKTVSAVIDFLMQMTHDLESKFSSVNFDTYTGQLTKITAAVTDLRAQMVGVRAAVDTLNSMDHQPMRAHGSDQPLTVMQARRHGITKRLKENGTYDNTHSGATATSIQSALDELFALVKLAEVDHNVLRRNQANELYVDPVSVSNRPSAIPITQTANRINIAPTQLAHIRRDANQSFPASAQKWNMLGDVLNEVVFDSLVQAGSPIVTRTDGGIVFTVQRDGYYLVEISATHLVSVVINGNLKNVTTWRGILHQGNTVSGALWSDVDAHMSDEINLFMQLLV